MNSLLGMPIHSSPLATETVFEVQQWPTKKKRRGYYVVKKQRPCAYVISGSLDFLGGADRLVIHPDALKHIVKIGL